MKLKEKLKQKKARNMGLIFFFLCVILLILGFGFREKEDDGVASLSTLFNKKEGLIAQGVIETQEVNINSKVPGRVLTIYVQEGKEVKLGDSLVEISSDELKAKKMQAEAAVRQAKAGLKAAEELYEQAKAGVEASNGLVQQAKAGVTAASGKVNEAKAGVKASQKQLESATAVKEKAENGARTQEITQAETAYNLMKASYERVAILVEKGAVSQQKLDEIKAQLDVSEQVLSMAKEGARKEDKKAATAVSEQAAAGVEASESRVGQAEAGLTAAQAQLTQAMAGVDSSNALLYQAQAGVEAKKGLVEQAKGALAEVNAYLNEVIIKSPIDGTVTTINSEEGELVSSGTQIGIVSNLKEAWLEVSVKETDLNQIKEGQSVAVKVLAYPEQEFIGTVTTINAQPSFAVKRATNENGDFDIVSFGVKIKLDNKEQILRPGMSAYVQFKNAE